MPLPAPEATPSIRALPAIRAWPLLAVTAAALLLSGTAAYGAGDSTIAVRMSATIQPVMCRDGDPKPPAACTAPQVSTTLRPLRYAVPRASPAGEIVGYEVRVDPERKVVVRTQLY